MLSGLLKSDVVAKVNVQIIDAFVAMRKYISSTLLNQNFINNLVYKHYEEIKLLKDSFDKLQEKKKVNTIFFEGKIYDAYSLLLDILKEISINIIICSTNMNKILIKKYKSQYNNVELMFSDKFHDRFIIIDKKIYITVVVVLKT